LCLPLHLLWLLLRRRSPWPPRFLGLAARAVGARVTVTGALPAGRSFLIANHVSWIDILALGGATGAAFVGHDGIARWPVIGWLARQNGTLFVSRERRGGLAAQIDGLRAVMDGHQPVALFPEGTTSDGATLLPFKPALLSVLLPPIPGMAVQPIHIDYGASAADIAWVGDEPAAANAMRVLARKGPLSVTIHLLAPFDPASCADRKMLAATARARILASMAQQTPSAIAPPPV
jgi:1-acyl-sn-glycerol-3-phosphate acyltransferase